MILSIQLARLRKTKKKLVDKLKNGGSSGNVAADAHGENYIGMLEQHLKETRAYHEEQKGGQDIALDIDPDVPLNRRTAALRHALLIAEKECFTQGDNANWDLLGVRYQQLIQFHEDFPPSNDADQAEIEQLEEELRTARKRISNLEKFKALYFDLEKSWNESKQKAETIYKELQVMVPEESNAEDFTHLLQSYHEVHSGISDLLEREEAAELAAIDTSDGGLEEITHLRAIAAEQNRVIEELQQQLTLAKANDSMKDLVNNMEVELKKQARFMQESETCIKLMEEELISANKELASMTVKVQQMPQMRQLIKELREAENSNKQVISGLKQENRRLAQKIKLHSEAAPEEDASTRSLRRELTSMQSKYADLEERYLNLKLQS